MAWGNSGRISEVLIAQKKIIRTIMFKGFAQSCPPLFRDLKVLTAISVYVLQRAKHVKKNINKFVRVREVQHAYSLRNNESLRLPSYKLSLTGNSSIIMPMKIYNHLPNSIKEAENLNKFKRGVVELLVQHSFYDINEYFSHNFDRIA